jgi:effector-binding domain-containing protein
MTDHPEAPPMTHTPQISQRAAQPYVAIALEVTPETLARSIDRGFPELFGWLAEHGVAPAGAPFIRYRVVDADGEPLELELAAPVAGDVPGDERVRADVLPAGHYVTYLHVGPFRSETATDIADARNAMLAWAWANNVALDRRETDRGSEPGCYVEHYRSDPRTEPDFSKWETELAYAVRP